MRMEVNLSTPHGALRLRPVRDSGEDAAFLHSLFVAVRAADMAAMPIDAAGKDYLLRMQYASMAETYRRDYPRARFEVIELAGQPVGRIVIDVGEDCVTYVDLALLPGAQRRGLATMLMTRLLEEPRALGLPARVRVLATNIASLRLLSRLGFVPSGSSPPFLRLEWRAA